MNTITVPAVSAALLIVHRDCETCENRRTMPLGLMPCPDCRNVCEWVTVDGPLEVGSTIHIEAGPAPEHGQWVGEWATWGKPSQSPPSPYLFHSTIPKRFIPLRPGVVVATGVVTECLEITRYNEGDRWSLLAFTDHAANDIDSPHMPPDAHGLFIRRCRMNEGRPGWEMWSEDISDQRLDQDWSPTRPCGHCDESGAVNMDDAWLDANEPIGDGWQGVTPRRTCPDCDGAGTLPRYAIRLTNVEGVTA